MKKVAIIGAGIAGIASGIRMAIKGYGVKVFESNAYAGGKLSSFEIDDYRFDAGPSLFTMPNLVTELFELAGKNPEDYFEYLKLDETCRYFWEDGTTLTAFSEPELLAKEMNERLNEPAQNVIDHLADSAKKYEITEKLFLHRSLHKIGTYFNQDAFKGYANAHQLEAFRTMNSANERRFEQPKTVQLFNRYATYNGSDPYQTPATMNIIPHLEFNIGAFFPKEGMVSITKSLVKLAQDLGVIFYFNTKVQEIIIEKNKVVGCKIQDTDGIKVEYFDIVISNMDIVGTFKKLLPNAKQPNRILKQPKSSSALIFYWGVKKAFPELGLHNIFFSDNYRSEFEHIFKQKTVYNDPTVYVNITSKHKPDDAPNGSENWFVMVNVPNNEGQDWESLITDTRKNIIEKLSRNLKIDFSELIDCEAILDPKSIELKTSSTQGALYGNSSNNKFAAFLRHSNFSSQYENLFFVGGSVHPGGGIPLCLLSAKIMSELC